MSFLVVIVDELIKWSLPDHVWLSAFDRIRKYILSAESFDLKIAFRDANVEKGFPYDVLIWYFQLIWTKTTKYR